MAGIRTHAQAKPLKTLTPTRMEVCASAHHVRHRRTYSVTFVLEPVRGLQVLSPSLSYSLWVSLGVLAAFIIRRSEARRLGYTKHPGFAWVGVGSLLGAVLGAKLGMWMYVDSQSVWELFIDITRLRFDGKTILGALAGGYLVGEVTKKLVGIEFSTGDALALALPVGQAFGRLGCFWAGCCPGTETTSVFGVNIDGAFRHPTAVYESLGCVAIAFFLLKAQRHLRVPGILFLTYLLLYASLRFGLEFIRADARPGPLHLSAAQWFCLAGVAFIFLRWQQLQRKASLTG